jgi:hypothetical protein
MSRFLSLNEKKSVEKRQRSTKKKILRNVENDEK